MQNGDELLARLRRAVEASHLAVEEWEEAKRRRDFALQDFEQKTIRAAVAKDEVLKAAMELLAKA